MLTNSKNALLLEKIDLMLKEIENNEHLICDFYKRTPDERRRDNSLYDVLNYSLNRAFDLGDDKLAKQLIMLGADPDYQSDDCDNRNTPLHKAVMMNPNQTYQGGLIYMLIFDYIADVFLKNADGHTPLDIATPEVRYEMLSMVIDRECPALREEYWHTMHPDGKEEHYSLRAKARDLRRELESAPDLEAYWDQVALNTD